jgi:hypothetical protein
VLSPVADEIDFVSPEAGFLSVISFSLVAELLLHDKIIIRQKIKRRGLMINVFFMVYV